MEPILVIIAVLVVAIVGGAYFLVSQRSGKGPELEPPRTGGVLAPPRPTTPTAEPGVDLEDRPGVVVEEPRKLRGERQGPGDWLPGEVLPAPGDGDEVPVRGGVRHDGGPG